MWQLSARYCTHRPVPPCLVSCDAIGIHCCLPSSWWREKCSVQLLCTWNSAPGVTSAGTQMCKFLGKERGDCLSATPWKEGEKRKDKKRRSFHGPVWYRWGYSGRSITVLLPFQRHEFKHLPMLKSDPSQPSCKWVKKSETPRHDASHITLSYMPLPKETHIS